MPAKIIPMYTRRLRVAYKWQPTNNSPGSFKERRVPFINIAGVWLERAGFSIGENVTIVVETNQLTIVKGGYGDDGVEIK
jgi:toxic protein SymE